MTEKKIYKKTKQTFSILQLKQRNIGRSKEN